MLQRVCGNGNLPALLMGNASWYSKYGEQYGGALKKKKIELPHDPTIPLLGIYPEKDKNTN